MHKVTIGYNNIKVYKRINALYSAIYVYKIFIQIKKDNTKTPTIHYKTHIIRVVALNILHPQGL